MCREKNFSAVQEHCPPEKKTIRYSPLAVHYSLLAIRQSPSLRLGRSLALPNSFRPTPRSVPCPLSPVPRLKVGNDAPKEDGAIGVGRSEKLPVRRKGDRVDQAYVTFQRAKQPTFNVPNLDSFVVASRCNQIAVRGENCGVDWTSVTPDETQETGTKQDLKFPVIRSPNRDGRVPPTSHRLIGEAGRSQQFAVGRKCHAPNPTCMGDNGVFGRFGFRLPNPDFAVPTSHRKEFAVR